MTTKSHTDGISTVHETTISLRRSRGKTFCDEPEALLCLLRAAVPSFEGAITDAETFWRTVPYEYDPAPLSLGWYAKKILREIRTMRWITEGRPNVATIPVETIVVWAMGLGTLITEAQWRFGLGDAVRTGAKVRAKNKSAAKVRGADIRATSTKLDTLIGAAVLEYRKQHPTHSARTTARNLATKLSIGEATIRRRLTRKKTA